MEKSGEGWQIEGKNGNRRSTFAHNARCARGYGGQPSRDARSDAARQPKPRAKRAFGGGWRRERDSLDLSGRTD